MQTIIKEELTDTLTLRKLTAKDAPSYRDLRLTALKICPKNFAADYETELKVSLTEIEDRLTHAIYIGVFEQDALIGSVCMHREPLEKMSHKGHIGEMFVDESKRGRGIGRKLLEELITVAKDEGLTQLYLAVWDKNEPAIKLYKSLGFEIFAEEKNALRFADGSTVDEFYMRLDFTPLRINCVMLAVKPPLEKAFL